MAGRGAIPVELSPDYTEAIRYRYVETDQPVREICAELGISVGKINRLIVRHNWPRRTERPPRELPMAARLHEESRRLVAGITSPRLRGEVNAPSRSEGASGEGEPPSPSAPSDSPSPGEHRADAQCSPPSPRTRGEGEDAPTAPTTLDAAARIEALILQELAAEEAVRARLGTAPRERADAARIAHTLATHTQTLQNLARLRAGYAAPPDHGLPHDDAFNDDMPADLDAFRDELARRINAFVDSRTDAGHAGGDPDAAVVAPVRP